MFYCMDRYPVDSGAKVFYREHPLLTTNHSFKTCDGPEAFTSTTDFMKCGGETSSGGQERYTLKTHLELYVMHSSFLRLKVKVIKGVQKGHGESRLRKKV